MAALSLATEWARARWETRRLLRHWLAAWGYLGVVGLVGLVLAAGVLVAGLLEQARSAELAVGIETTKSAPLPEPSGAQVNQQRLEAFDAYLPAAAEIPATIQGLISLARQHRLLLKTADYKPQAEPGGRYLGYHISLPVRGNAMAVQEFVLSALQQSRTLALQSVTFKRERIESSEIEARIQFTFFTREPLGGVSRVDSR